MRKSSRIPADHPPNTSNHQGSASKYPKVPPGSSEMFSNRLEEGEGNRVGSGAAGEAGRTTRRSCPARRIATRRPNRPEKPDSGHSGPPAFGVLPSTRTARIRYSEPDGAEAWAKGRDGGTLWPHVGHTRTPYPRRPQSRPPRQHGRRSRRTADGQPPASTAGTPRRGVG